MVRGRERATSTDHEKGAHVPHVAAAKRAEREPSSPRKSRKITIVISKVHGKKVPFDVMDFKTAFHSSSHDRLEVIKAGIKAKRVFDLATVFKVSQDEMIQRLGLTKTTVHRKARTDETLSADQSERVLGMAKLLGLVETIVSESVEDDDLQGFDAAKAQDFDAAAWLENWLSQPNPALGGELPSTYLDTREGQEILSTLIAQMQSGAYA